jgi:Lecithin:cholesterol acyltransferase
MPKKPVVFIPGFIATRLVHRPTNRTLFPPSLGDLADAQRKQELVDLLSAPKFDDPSDDVQPAEPIRNLLGISQQADALYSILSGNFGYDISPTSTDFRAVGWDWRKAVDDTQTQEAVANAIDELFAATAEKVVLLPHSTGGLVVRKLLEDRPELTAKIDQVISFGIPWAGTFAAVRALDEPAKVGVLIFSLSAEEVKRITTNTQAAYDLCPPDPARSMLTLEDGTPLNLFVENGQQAAPMLRTAWMTDPALMVPLAQKADQRLGARTPTIQLSGGHVMPPITNVAGWGIASPETVTLLPNNTLRYDATEEKRSDGTVPLVSAAWLRGADVRTMVLPIGAYPVNNIPRRHSRIWDAPPVVQLLHEVLEDAPRRPFVAASVDGDDFSNPNKATVRIRVTAVDDEGKALPNCTVVFRGITRKKFPIDRFQAFDVPRDNLNPNVNGTTFFRMELDVTWDGGKADPRPVVIFHVQ